MTRTERLEEIRKRWVEPAPDRAPHFPYDMTNEAAEDIPWLLSELSRLEEMRPPRPCAAGHDHERKTIGLGLFLGPGGPEVTDETYGRWARRNGRNPWCYKLLTECPEP